MIQKDVTIVNRLGLHARAASKFVTVASRFESDIRVQRDGREVNGKSIMGVMLLAAAKGTQITIAAEGTDEHRAMEALESLIERKFGEEE